MSRPLFQINTMVELLKSQVISFATLELRKKMQEDKDRKPIEEWTRMASLVAGAQEETVSDAFSRVLQTYIQYLFVQYFVIKNTLHYITFRVHKEHIILQYKSTSKLNENKTNALIKD